MKTLIVNCSYRTNGTAAKLCALERERFGAENCIDLFLPDVRGCCDCTVTHCATELEKCCLVKDRSMVKQFVDMALSCRHIVFVTPVYLNAPTPKVLAMLSRINTYNDRSGRALFSAQLAYVTACADISGTQQTISIMTSALNFLGFAFPSKGNREHVLEWKTGKVRGSNLKTPSLYLEDRVKGGNL